MRRKNNFKTPPLHLEFPGEKEIKEAFLKLPAQGSLELNCMWDKRLETLHALEKNGFFGIHITCLSPKNSVSTISAWKGKEGPCYETGKYAHYNGAALGVIDDDNHLYLGKTGVCEKTAEILSLPVYTGHIRVSGESGCNESRKPFNCGTFEEDLKRLAQLPFEQRKNAEQKILYPGPFKALILTDGSYIRRGEIYSVSAEQACRLTQNGECHLFENGNKQEHPQSFPELFASSGIPGILAHTAFTQTSASAVPPKLEALSRIDKTTQKRITDMIRHKKSYFILTGSDPEDPYGCCPSGDVGMADTLVKAGILKSRRTNETPGTCPTRLYTFSGETGENGEDLNFSINKNLRQQVFTFLEKKSTQIQRRIKTVIQWSLLGFLLTSLYFLILPEPPFSANSPEVPQNGIIVYYFHPAARCAPCLTMEALTEKTLKEEFGALMKENKIRLA